MRGACRFRMLPAATWILTAEVSDIVEAAAILLLRWDRRASLSLQKTDDSGMSKALTQPALAGIWAKAVGGEMRDGGGKLDVIRLACAPSRPSGQSSTRGSSSTVRKASDAVTERFADLVG